MKAFTLIEMIMVISIVVILTMIGIGSYNTFFNKASMASEIAAGRNLISAYHNAVSDNSGNYPPARDYTAKDVRDANGKILPMREMRARYPFRLAPYFDYKMEGTILVNKNKKQILEIFGKGSMYNYGLTIFPAMGINNIFFGGYKLANGKMMHEGDAITTMANSDKRIVAFVSAGVDGVDGYEYVRPPYYWGGNENGFVDFRYDKKAVVVFSDGSVKALGVKELKDMRLWSRNAAMQNNPNYIP
jgi:prepilin-type N-terminal cleavage/methylation domain-containing protein